MAGAALLKPVAAARELRDRYLEQFNSGLVLPNGKYDVSRAIAAASQIWPRLPGWLIRRLKLRDMYLTAADRSAPRG